jgi:hypothetical protein
MNPIGYIVTALFVISVCAAIFTGRSSSARQKTSFKVVRVTTLVTGGLLLAFTLIEMTKR